MSQSNADPNLRPNNPESVTPTPPAKPRRRRRSCMRWGILLAVFVVSASVAFRFVLKSKFTEEQWEKIQKAQTEVVSLPEEWHQPATLPPLEVVRFHHDLATSVTQLYEPYEDLLWGDFSLEQSLLHRLRTNDELSTDEQTSLTQFLTDLEPVLLETSRTVHSAGYTAELELYANDSSFLSMQTFAKFASIAALEAMRNGEPIRAMETAAVPLRITKRPEQAFMTTHLIAATVSVITVHTFQALAEMTTDTVALKRGLDLLTELRPVVYHNEMKHWEFGDTLGWLGFAAANGYEVDLTPQTPLDYYEQANTMLGPHYYKWVTENLPPEDLRAQKAAAALYYYLYPVDFEDVFSGSGDDMMNNLMELERPGPETAEPKAIPEKPDPDSLSYRIQKMAAELFMGIHPYGLLYVNTLPTIELNQTRFRVSLASYDLVRIHFARRLAELGAPVDMPTGQEASTSTIAAYLSPVPDDPFTSAPFIFSRSLQKDYSVGPDKTGNNSEILYDATNGTLSAGDVWVEAR